MAIFFLYFDYFREPNDIDKRLSGDLFDAVPGLEIPLIEIAIRDAEMVGTDTRKLKERLKELVDLKES